jgi:hypothetical protein
MFGRIKALFNSQNGPRWSLYFFHKHEGLRYALHDDGVAILLDYVSAPIKKGKIISPDWELHINFNFEHKSIRLVEAFFSEGDVSQTLLDLIAIIDAEWMVAGGEPVFVDARSRKRLPLGTSGWNLLNDTQRTAVTRERIENCLLNDKETQVTLASVLSEVMHQPWCCPISPPQTRCIAR